MYEQGLVTLHLQILNLKHGVFYAIILISVHNFHNQLAYFRSLPSLADHLVRKYATGQPLVLNHVHVLFQPCIQSFTTTLHQLHKKESKTFFFENSRPIFNNCHSKVVPNLYKLANFKFCNRKVTQSTIYLYGAVSSGDHVYLILPQILGLAAASSCVKRCNCVLKMINLSL